MKSNEKERVETTPDRDGSYLVAEHYGFDTAELCATVQISETSENCIAALNSKDARELGELLTRAADRVERKTDQKPRSVVVFYIEPSLGATVTLEVPLTVKPDDCAIYQELKALAHSNKLTYVGMEFRNALGDAVRVEGV